MSKSQRRRVIKNEELEALYQLYPKRLSPNMGKATGHKRLKSRLVSESRIEAFTKAVKSIAEMVKSGDLDRAYVPMWSTFANRYEDYLPENLNIEVKDDSIGMIGGDDGGFSW